MEVSVEFGIRGQLNWAEEKTAVDFLSSVICKNKKKKS